MEATFHVSANTPTPQYVRSTSGRAPFDDMENLVPEARLLAYVVGLLVSTAKLYEAYILTLLSRFASVSIVSRTTCTSILYVLTLVHGMPVPLLCPMCIGSLPATSRIKREEFMNAMGTP